jgi:hypothetical protein
MRAQENPRDRCPGQAACGWFLATDAGKISDSPRVPHPDQGPHAAPALLLLVFLRVTRVRRADDGASLRLVLQRRLP